MVNVIADKRGEDTLAKIGFDVINLFSEVSGSFKEGEQQFQIVQQMQRFDLWATNIGLHQRGHASLDYRFRDAATMSQLCRSYLEDMVESLKILKSEFLIEPDSLDGHLPLDDPDELIDLSDDSEALGDYDDESTTEAALANIADSIDRLFRLSMKVRHPSIRTGLSRGLNYRQIDHETGIDLFDCFASRRIDEENIQSIVDGYRAKKDPTARSIDFLISRLAKANNQRRRQFAYWSHHKLKLVERNQKARESYEQKSQYSVPTTATLLDPAKIRFDDETRSNISTISIKFTELADSSKDILLFPDPPANFLSQENLKEFECPYCFTICPRRTLERRNWRAHLLKDLRPYVCTFTNCNSESQVYDSITDWMGHESSHFNSLDSTCPHESRVCPFCLKSFQNLDFAAQHIATHLVRIALFTMPRSTAAEIADEEGDSSSALSHKNIGSDSEGSGKLTPSGSLNFSDMNERASGSDEESDVNNRSSVKISERTKDTKAKDHTSAADLAEKKIVNEDENPSDLSKITNDLKEGISKLGNVAQDPVYVKVHRDHLSKDTLAYYDLPWEYDRADKDYFIILREMDQKETDIIFEHTRRLRERTILQPERDENTTQSEGSRQRSNSAT